MKFIRFVIFILLLSAMVSLAAVFNFRAVFGKPAALKTVLSQSDAYNVVSAAIRENIALQNGDLTDLDKAAGGNLMEILNEKVGPDGLRVMAEDFIDQMYDPSNTGRGQYVLRYSMLKDKLGPDVQLPADKIYEFNVPSINSKSMTLALACSGLGVIILLCLHFWIVGDTLKRKMKWAGLNFFLTALILAAISVTLFYIIPNMADKIISIFGFENQRIANGMIKALDAALGAQKIYYFVEFGAALVLALVLIVLSKIAKETGPTIIPNEPGKLK